MNRKLKVIISVIAVIIGLVIIKNSLPLNRKANEVFGNVYCGGHSRHELVGMALTPWTCELCGYSEIERNTGVPVICSKCAAFTGRCEKCGGKKILLVEVYKGITEGM